MSDRRLKYSERKRLAESGTLGDFVHESVPEPLRFAIFNYLQRKTDYYSRTTLQNKASEHFGWPPGTQVLQMVQANAEVEPLADILEILVQDAALNPRKLEDDLNQLFERHRFG
jgi:hypothetical protein